MKIATKCHICNAEINPVIQFPPVPDAGCTEPFEIVAVELRVTPCESCLEDAVRLRFKRLMDRLIQEVKS